EAHEVKVEGIAQISETRVLCAEVDKLRSFERKDIVPGPEGRRDRPLVGGISHRSIEYSDILRATEVRQQDPYPIHKIEERASQVGPRFPDLALAHLERLSQSLIIQMRRRGRNARPAEPGERELQRRPELRLSNQGCDRLGALFQLFEHRTFTHPRHDGGRSVILDRKARRLLGRLNLVVPEDEPYVLHSDEPDCPQTVDELPDALLGGMDKGSGFQLGYQGDDRGHPLPIVSDQGGQIWAGGDELVIAEDLHCHVRGWQDAKPVPAYQVGDCLAPLRIHNEHRLRRQTKERLLCLV
ncbi:MAG TPA: hypothetical protein VGS21_01685, partial [Acidimicrobiales bacterium]|nr:hypothetical protein [Acidimicrobiales bacterium]